MKVTVCTLEERHDVPGNAWIEAAIPGGTVEISVVKGKLHIRTTAPQYHRPVILPCTRNSFYVSIVEVER